MTFLHFDRCNPLLFSGHGNPLHLSGLGAPSSSYLGAVTSPLHPPGSEISGKSELYLLKKHCAQMYHPGEFFQNLNLKRANIPFFAWRQLLHSAYELFSFMHYVIQL